MKWWYDMIQQIEDKTKHVSLWEQDGRYFLIGALFKKEITRYEHDDYKQLNKHTQSRLNTSQENVPDVMSHA